MYIHEVKDSAKELDAMAISQMFIDQSLNIPPVPLNPQPVNY